MGFYSLDTESLVARWDILFDGSSQLNPPCSYAAAGNNKKKNRLGCCSAAVILSLCICVGLNLLLLQRSPCSALIEPLIKG